MSNKFKLFKNRIKNFHYAEQGSILVLFAFALIAVIAVLTLAIGFNRTATSESEFQGQLRSATVGVAKEIVKWKVYSDFGIDPNEVGDFSFNGIDGSDDNLINEAMIANIIGDHVAAASGKIFIPDGGTTTRSDQGSEFCVAPVRIINSDGDDISINSENRTVILQAVLGYTQASDFDIEDDRLGDAQVCDCSSVQNLLTSVENNRGCQTVISERVILDQNNRTDVSIMFSLEASGVMRAHPTNNSINLTNSAGHNGVSGMLELVAEYLDTEWNAGVNDPEQTPVGANIYNQQLVCTNGNCGCPIKTESGQVTYASMSDLNPQEKLNFGQSPDIGYSGCVAAPVNNLNDFSAFHYSNVNTGGVVSESTGAIPDQHRIFPFQVEVFAHSSANCSRADDAVWTYQIEEYGTDANGQYCDMPPVKTRTKFHDKGNTPATANQCFDYTTHWFGLPVPNCNCDNDNWENHSECYRMVPGQRRYFRRVHWYQTCPYEVTAAYPENNQQITLPGAAAPIPGDDAKNVAILDDPLSKIKLRAVYMARTDAPESDFVIEGRAVTGNAYGHAFRFIRPSGGLLPFGVWPVYGNSYDTFAILSDFPEKNNDDVTAAAVGEAFTYECVPPQFTTPPNRYRIASEAFGGQEYPGTVYDIRASGDGRTGLDEYFSPYGGNPPYKRCVPHSVPTTGGSFWVFAPKNCDLNNLTMDNCALPLGHYKLYMDVDNFEDVVAAPFTELDTVKVRFTGESPRPRYGHSEYVPAAWCAAVAEGLTAINPNRVIDSNSVITETGANQNHRYKYIDDEILIARNMCFDEHGNPCQAGGQCPSQPHAMHGPMGDLYNEVYVHPPIPREMHYISSVHVNQIAESNINVGTVFDGFNSEGNLNLGNYLNRNNLLDARHERTNAQQNVIFDNSGGYGVCRDGMECGPYGIGIRNPDIFRAGDGVLALQRELNGKSIPLGSFDAGVGDLTAAQGVRSADNRPGDSLPGDDITYDLHGLKCPQTIIYRVLGSVYDPHDDLPHIYQKSSRPLDNIPLGTAIDVNNDGTRDDRWGYVTNDLLRYLQTPAPSETWTSSDGGGNAFNPSDPNNSNRLIRILGSYLDDPSGNNQHLRDAYRRRKPDADPTRATGHEPLAACFAMQCSGNSAISFAQNNNTKPLLMAYITCPYFGAGSDNNIQTRTSFYQQSSSFQSPGEINPTYTGDEIGTAALATMWSAHHTDDLQVNFTNNDSGGVEGANADYDSDSNPISTFGINMVNSTYRCFSNVRDRIEAAGGSVYPLALCDAGLGDYQDIVDDFASNNCGDNDNETCGIDLSDLRFDGINDINLNNMNSIPEPIRRAMADLAYHLLLEIYEDIGDGREVNQGTIVDDF